MLCTSVSNCESSNSSNVPRDVTLFVQIVLYITSYDELVVQDLGEDTWALYITKPGDCLNVVEMGDRDLHLCIYLYIKNVGESATSLLAAFRGGWGVLCSL